MPEERIPEEYIGEIEELRRRTREGDRDAAEQYTKLILESGLPLREEDLSALRRAREHWEGKLRRFQDNPERYRGEIERIMEIVAKLTEEIERWKAGAYFEKQKRSGGRDLNPRPAGLCLVE